MPSLIPGGSTMLSVTDGGRGPGGDASLWNFGLDDDVQNCSLRPKFYGDAGAGIR